MAFSRVFRAVQVILLVYALVAVLYTTNCLLVSPISVVLFRGDSKDLTLLRSAGRNTGLFDLGGLLWNSHGSFYEEQDQSEALDLQIGPNISFQGLSLLNEDLVLSKAFSQSMHPSKIIPYFYRATGAFGSEDITISTLITSNRFEVFKRLVERYQGPVSVAIHVKNNADHVHTLLDALHDLYTSTPLMSTYVDVHLIVDTFDRQFNTWRNVARFFARTEYIMMLDVDFHLCTDFRSGIQNSPEVMALLQSGEAALVVPAFEYVKQSEGLNASTFPRDKATLLERVKEGHLDIFHRSWAPGHNSTDYERFYTAAPGEVYKVTQYQSAYEPYVILKKEGPPWCDERFVGYGGNKAACLFEMYLSGISFYVLSDHFLIHQSHKYEEEARKNERKYNKKIYTDFKEEACLRYLKHSYDNGHLTTPRGYNVQEECRKIKGLSKTAAQLLDGQS